MVSLSFGMSSSAIIPSPEVLDYNRWFSFHPQTGSWWLALINKYFIEGTEVVGTYSSLIFLDEEIAADA